MFIWYTVFSKQVLKSRSPGRPGTKTLAVEIDRVSENGGAVIIGIVRCCLWDVAAQLKRYVRNIKTLAKHIIAGRLR
jgi:hypothetical protein